MVVAVRDTGQAPAEWNDAWRRGYAAFTVNTSRLGKVRSYVERQESHQWTMTF